MKFWVWPAVLGLLLVVQMADVAWAQTQLANHQKAALKIVISEKASDSVKSAAANLADYLKRISDAEFKIETGDGRTGIAVGLADDFPDLRLEREFDVGNPDYREQYLLRSHDGGVYVIGAGEVGVDHAAWDLLYRLGHRQFFPGPAWEVIPQRSDLSINVNTVEKPDYFVRAIWYGYGTWNINLPALKKWRVVNRAESAFSLNTGHIYNAIVQKYQTEFTSHPEYFCHIDGRPTNKLCAGQQGTRDLVVRYALDFFAKNPLADSVSVEPSDGEGWCTSGPCVAIGSPSDRAVTFANDVAEALQKRYPNKFAALYAYNAHASAPHIQVNPRVIVTVATAFTRGHSPDQLMKAWAKQGARQFGIREYYSVNPWDHDLPSSANGGNLAYLCRTIPEFHRLGARFLTAESGDNWGAYGLGYYLATRMMWDVNEAQHIDELKADFYEKAFGPAAQPMAGFYGLLDGSSTNLVSDDMVGRMYRFLYQARKLAGNDQAIQARLDDLTLYTRYVELFRAYGGAVGADRQVAFEQLIRFAYRIRSRMMVHSLALYRDAVLRDRAVSIPKEAAWNVDDKRNPWKSSEPFSYAELTRFISDGLTKYKLMDFAAVAYSKDLVPATPLKLPKVSVGAPDWQGRGQRVYSTWVEHAPAEIRLKITGGLIPHYRHLGGVKIQLFPKAEVEGLAVAEDNMPADGQTREIVLKTNHEGLHYISVMDGMNQTRVELQSPQWMTYESSINCVLNHPNRQNFVFYVPRKTRIVGGFSLATTGRVYDSQGRQVYQFDNAGYFQIPVAPGQDGNVWSVRGVTSSVRFMTVPPFISNSTSALMLPREVVEADAR